MTLDRILFGTAGVLTVQRKNSLVTVLKQFTNLTLIACNLSSPMALE